MAAIPPDVVDTAVTDRPVCVDLNEALLPGTLSFEMLLARVKASPASVFRARLGRPGDASLIDVERLPYNQVLLAELRAERARGRRVVLVSAGDVETAERVAAHLGVFDEVVAKGGTAGGAHTAPADLTERYGEAGFEFVGTARRAAEVGARVDQSRIAPAAHAPPDLRLILRAVRAHQWLKNALIFLPVLAGQQFDDLGIVVRALLAFVAFSLTASCVYVINDALDLREDRRHPRKRERPFASGRLPLSWAPWLVAGMLTAAAAISIFVLPPLFSAVLGGYLVLTFAYSLKLKGAALIDVFLLAALYTLRVIAGAAATGIELSVWLLGFCMFFFLSLALVKRYAELHSLLSAASPSARLPGRSYRAVDLPVLVAMGVATGCMSVLVLALYMISDEFAQHYTRQLLLWQLCPLTLYWIGRAWLVVARDEMHDDPLVWAVKDQLSRWVAISALAILIIAR